MAPQRDPEETATRHLHELTNLSDARVLEIGSGDGNLTFRYAAAAGRVTGMDPNGARLAAALRHAPPSLRAKLSFVRARAEALPFRCETFDIAFLAWSL